MTKVGFNDPDVFGKQHPRSIIYDDSGITMSGTRSTGLRSRIDDILHADRAQPTRKEFLDTYPTEEIASPAVLREPTKFQGVLHTRIFHDKHEHPCATWQWTRDEQAALIFLPCQRLSELFYHVLLTFIIKNDYYMTSRYDKFKYSDILTLRLFTVQMVYFNIKWIKWIKIYRICGENLAT